MQAPQEFDEPGMELGKDAQVWKTYMKEADQMDAELVDKWNRTLDVILIFAALFATISSAFVMESYKHLKQDPADASAQTLLIMSHTLLAMASGNKTFNTLVSAPTSPTNFTVSRSAIWVNALWFLSLTLSVAVSLLAMLAKEWSFSFMSGRTGSPVVQARRRQQRWDGIINWKMQDVLMFLPSLIHLSLLLFALGLAVFLWDVHRGVAIPVIVVVIIAFCIYVACVILPFVDAYCPYGMVVSGMYADQGGIELEDSPQESKQDQVTSRALCWILKTCKTPRSIEVALQSLAAATTNLPTSLLESYNAWPQIGKLYMIRNSQYCEHDPALLLYSRALLFWGSRRSPIGHDSTSDQFEPSKIDTMLWAMQSKIETFNKGYISCGYSRVLKPVTRVEVSRLTKDVAYHCIRALRHGGSRKRPNGGQHYTGSVNHWTLIGDITNQLERHFQHSATLGVGSLERAEYLSLFVGFSAILCCGMVYRPPSDIIPYLMRLVRAEQKDYSLELEVVIFAFAFSRHDYPTTSGSADQLPLDPVTRAERALEVLCYYTTLRCKCYQVEALGLLHLLSQSQAYGLLADDLRAINDRFQGLSTKNARVPTLPPDFSIHSQAMDDITQHLSKHPDIFGPEFTYNVQACLRALQTTYDPRHSPAPTNNVYVFVLESLCRATSFESINTGLMLLGRFPFPQISDIGGIAELLASRSIILQLVATLNHSNPSLQLFAMAQLCLLITILSRLEDAHEAARQILQTELLKCVAALGKNSQSMDEVAEGLYNRFSTHLGTRPANSHNVADVTYFYRVLGCMVEIHSSASDPRMETVEDMLAHVPQSLRESGTWILTRGDGTLIP